MMRGLALGAGAAFSDVGGDALRGSEIDKGRDRSAARHPNRKRFRLAAKSLRKHARKAHMACL